jgi:hypothetical protein
MEFYKSLEKNREPFLANGNLKYVPLLLWLYRRKNITNNLLRIYILTEHISLKLNACCPLFFFNN